MRGGSDYQDKAASNPCRRLRMDVRSHSWCRGSGTKRALFSVHRQFPAGHLGNLWPTVASVPSAITRSRPPLFVCLTWTPSGMHAPQATNPCHRGRPDGDTCGHRGGGRRLPRRGLPRSSLARAACPAGWRLGTAYCVSPELSELQLARPNAQAFRDTWFAAEAAGYRERDVTRPRPATTCTSVRDLGCRRPLAA